MLEIKTLVANILLSYSIAPITRVDELVFVADIVLRPKNLIKVKFCPRQEFNDMVELKST